MSATPIICRTCLLEMELPEGMTVLICPACGTSNSRPQAKGLTLSVLQRATRQRLACDFAAAEISYQQVLMEHYDEHEALWGRLLCHYGVEYVEDPKTGKRLPTVHSIRRKPLRAQQDFLYACSNAPEEVCAQYEAEAAYIDEVQQRVRDLAVTCKPYDVFLCHKTTIPGSGHYTEDFARANQLYTELRLMGYRVFFAPMEIQSAAGASYEAAIFHALETARVMLVVCSDKEYLNSPWVRSEWSRFMEMTSEQPDKRLLPLLYGGMPARQLPREFAIWNIQAVTMGEKDSWTHVLNAVQGAAGTPIPAAHTTPESAFDTLPNGAGCTVTGYHGTDPEVTIPDRIRGRQVISVALSAFTACDTPVTSLHIPAGVTSIEPGIPSDNAALASIGVDSGNPHYEIRANALCTRDGELVCFPPDAQAAHYAIPAGTRSIGEHAFAACRHLQSVSIPAGVTVIGSYAFDRCHALSYVKLPLGLSVIGECAFADCTSLESLQLPTGLTAIGENLLSGCTSLKEIRLPMGLQSVPENVCADCTALREATLSPGITVIGDCAFLNCASLEKLHIPADIQTIGECALDGCTALREITVAPGNRYFRADGEALFTKSGCLVRCLPALGLTSYTVPDGTTSLGDGSFTDCTTLQEITIPDSVQSISENALLDCHSSLTIHASPGSAAQAYALAHGLESLCCTPEELFETVSYKDGCKITGYKGGDGSLIIPPQIRGQKVLHLDDNAFAPDRSLKSGEICDVGRHFDVVRLPETLIDLFSTAFNGVSVRAYQVPCANATFMDRDGVLYMKDGLTLLAYPGDSSAISYTVPQGVTTIMALAFHHCSLRSVTLPEGLKVLKSCTFYGSERLSHVELPKGLEQIRELAFHGCTALREMEIPRSVTEINPNAFKNCGQLTLQVHRGSPAHAFALQHGIPCQAIGGSSNAAQADESHFMTEESGGTCTVTKYTGPGGEVCIPQMIRGKLVTAIGSRAFYDCDALTGVTLPEGVAKIGSEAFDSCSALATVALPEGLIELGNWAFRSCRKLQQVTLPSTLRRIDSYAFEYCHNLQQINLPESLEAISYNAFSECTALTEITIPSGIRVIEEHTFRKCTGLRRVVLPEGLTAIESNAFYNCSSLQEINLPASITTFGTDVFSGCSQLPQSIRSRSRETVFGIRSFFGF